MPRKHEVERRTLALDRVEVRDITDGDRQIRQIVGHAAVFNQLSDPIFFFREKIEPGAFRRTVNNDVRALFNHDANFVLGRTRSGTLRLAEDAVGLAIENDPPDTQLVRDLVMAPMERGDIDQMSFGFRVVRERWEGTLDEPIRVLEEVELFDVSIVTYPAYPQTDAQARSAEMRSALSSEPPADPGQEPHLADDKPPVDNWRDQWRKRRLKLAERSLNLRMPA